jgi:hypothetical protein
MCDRDLQPSGLAPTVRQVAKDQLGKLVEQGFVVDADGRLEQVGEHGGADGLVNDERGRVDALRAPPRRVAEQEGLDDADHAEVEGENESLTLTLGHAGLAWLAVRLHGIGMGGAIYLVTVGLPAALATYFMMFTNYIQHVDCAPASPDDHSRNFTNPLWNWFAFDNGFHTVHHEQPGVHWSRYRKLHTERAARIDPRLNYATPVGYLIDAYLKPSARRGPKPCAATTAPGNAPQSLEIT